MLGAQAFNVVLMEKSISKEQSVLQKVQAQPEEKREYMLWALAVIADAPNTKSVNAEHVKQVMEKCPTKERFLEEADKVVRFHVYGGRNPEKHPEVAEARNDARAACEELAGMIYG